LCPISSLSLGSASQAKPRTGYGFDERTRIASNHTLKDSQTYPTGLKVTDEQLAALNVFRDAFHGEWNYTILPHVSPTSGQLM
jgi:Rhodopirellula transposase DDE domain